MRHYQNFELFRHILSKLPLLLIYYNRKVKHKLTLFVGLNEILKVGIRNNETKLVDLVIKK